jgi:HEAT repeat protein
VNKKCPTCERNEIFHLRRNAIAILKKINNEKARMTLQELINDPDSAVANYMVKTLKHNDYKK